MARSGDTICWGVALVVGLLVPVQDVRSAADGHELPGALSQQTAPAPSSPDPQAPQPPPPAPPGAGTTQSPEASPPPEPATPLPFEIAWTGPVAEPVTPELVVTNTLVVTGGTGSPITARARETGLVVWTAPVTGTRALASSGTLIFSAGEEGITALDPLTGRTRWRLPTETDVRWLTTTPSALLYSSGNAARAVRLEDGTPLWQVGLGASAAAPIVADEASAIVALEDRTLLSVDLASGTERWRMTLDGVPETLAASHERVYFSLPHLSICTVEQASGEIDWCYRHLAIPSAGNPVVTDRHVYVVLMDNTLRVLHRGGGAMQKLEQLGDRAVSGPLPAGAWLAVPLRTGAFVLIGPDGRHVTLPPAPGDSVQTMQRAAVSPDGATLAGLTVSVAGTRQLTAYRLTARSK